MQTVVRELSSQRLASPDRCRGGQPIGHKEMDFATQGSFKFPQGHIPQFIMNQRRKSAQGKFVATPGFDLGTCGL